MSLIAPASVVSVDWLQANITAKNLIVLNATIPKVAGDETTISKYKIPNAIFFDIKKKFSDVNGKFPNTFPSEQQFTDEAQLLGINSDSCIIIYDEIGIYSSARAWWLFKSFGHDNVAVLDGGLPEWMSKNFIVEPKTEERTSSPGNFIGQYDSDKMCFFKDILEVSTTSEGVILDARSGSRFLGKSPEPRKGLRSGTIPSSKNLPYNDLLEYGKLRSISELENIFKSLSKPEDILYLSCGSGITACILALAASKIGLNNCCVYDGSWTEYGSLTSN